MTNADISLILTCDVTYVKSEFNLCFQLITQQQWEILFPPDRKYMSPEHYDLDLLIILLKHICHLERNISFTMLSLPQERDCSTEADISRIIWFHQYLSENENISDIDYVKFTEDLNKIFTRLHAENSKDSSTFSIRTRYSHTNSIKSDNNSIKSLNNSVLSGDKSGKTETQLTEETYVSSYSARHLKEKVPYDDIVKHYNTVFHNLAELEESIIRSLKEESNNISLLSKPIKQASRYRVRESTWTVNARHGEIKPQPGSVRNKKMDEIKTERSNEPLTGITHCINNGQIVFSLLIYIAYALFCN